MRDETLHVQTRRGSADGTLVLDLQGPLLCQNLFDFQQTVRLSGARALIVNMTDVPYVDSAGVGALVGAYVSFQKEGHQLALVRVSDRVQSLFNMTQVEKFFRIYGSVEEAEAAIGVRSASLKAATQT